MSDDKPQTDADIIQEAYADGLKDEFNQYCESMLVAMSPDYAAEKDRRVTEAIIAFKRGLALLRNARDTILSKL